MNQDQNKTKRYRVRPIIEKSCQKDGQGAPLIGKARELVYNVCNYFQREKEHGGPLLPLTQVVDRSVAALQVCRSTVTSISKQKLLTEDDPSALPSKARELVYNVFNYFQREEEHGEPLLPMTQVVDRSAAALQVSQNTVANISKEKMLMGNGPFALGTLPKQQIQFQENSEYLQDLEVATLEESGMFQSVLTLLREGTSTQSEDVACSKKKETVSGTIALTDTNQTISTNTTVSTGIMVTNSVFTQSNSSNSQERGKNIQEESKSDKISSKKLDSVIDRLESLSNKLSAATLFDQYDQFGKYISSLLRGLSTKRVNSLKKKILWDVMTALEEKEQDLSKNMKSVGMQVGLDVLGSEKSYREFLKEQSHARSLSVDSKSLASNTPIVDGNQPLIFPSESTSKSCFKPLPVISMSATTSMISSSTVISTTTAKSTDQTLLATTETEPKMSVTPVGHDQSSLQSPRGQKRKISTAAYPIKKSRTRDLQSQENSSDSGGGDDSTIVFEPLKCEELEFKIDIVEGNEHLLEAAFVGEESSSVYIKEEAPDLEKTLDDDLSAPPLPPVNTIPVAVSATFTCPLCSVQCNNGDELCRHFSSTHPVEQNFTTVTIPVQSSPGRAPLLASPLHLQSQQWAHFPVKIPPTASKQHPTRICKVCKTHKKRSETSWMCEKCQVALHIKKCFIEFHTKSKC